MVFSALFCEFMLVAVIVADLLGISAAKTAAETASKAKTFRIMFKNDFA